MSLTADQVQEFKSLLRELVHGNRTLDFGPTPTWEPNAFTHPPEEGEYVVVFRRGGNFPANRVGDIHAVPAMLCGVLGGNFYLGLNFVPASVWDEKELHPTHPLEREIACGLTEVYRSTEKIAIRLSASEATALASVAFQMTQDPSKVREAEAFVLREAGYFSEPYASQFRDLAKAVGERDISKLRSALEALGVQLTK